MGDCHAQSPPDKARTDRSADVNGANFNIVELIAGAQRMALVGLAKNTGKTQTLTSILTELASVGVRVGVSSIGRDGEEWDAIDARIEKPTIHLERGSIVASTDALLRASGVEHERLARTRVRTPLGEVVIARLSESGAVEIAGPSAAETMRAVCEEMLAHGAQQVLIDGSIDRRAASAPSVADGLVMATGAVLGESVDEVLAKTVDAADLIRLPAVAAAGAVDAAGATPVTIPRQIALSAAPGQIAALLRDNARTNTFLIDGALSERLLQGLLAARRERDGHELRVVARDPTRVFLSEHGPRWYSRQGIRIEVLETIDLRAITVNPVAPQSHRLDSHALREAISAAIPGVPVIDVLDPEYY